MCDSLSNIILVEIKISIDLRFDLQMGVDSIRTQDIQSGCCLGTLIGGEKVGTTFSTLAIPTFSKEVPTFSNLLDELSRHGSCP